VSARDATTRFSDRVDEYVRHRPGYPPALVESLLKECGLVPGGVVADIGSGTGKLTELLLAAGARVLAVEPNRGMREAAERLLGDVPGFRSVDGTAEATGLPPGTVDLVSAAQAFHWFDHAAARAEFARILKPGGSVALVWNERDDDASEFLRDYERCLRDYSVDYGAVDHRRTASRERIAAFFAPGGFREAEFPNGQDLDLDVLRGRYLSCSYALPRDHARFDEGMAALAALFARHQHGGRVRIDYRTRLYHGRLA
jgi:SAM-dependent methyltransferase